MGNTKRHKGECQETIWRTQTTSAGLEDSLTVGGCKVPMPDQVSTVVLTSCKWGGGGGAGGGGSVVEIV